MCFYNQKRWKCGYWRWDKFATRCPAERHMGETCGLKLVFKVFDQGPKCNICCDIDTKWRKISKMDRDLERWHREGNKPVTVELTLADRGAATAKIAELQQKHENDMKTLSVSFTRCSLACFPVRVLVPIIIGVFSLLPSDGCDHRLLFSRPQSREWHSTV
jgi:hypothetical protein